MDKREVTTDMIRPVKRSEIEECVDVIRKSFLTVAQEYGFSEENAPRFTAFATTFERLDWQYREGRPMYGYFDDKEQICGYYSLHIQDNGECELNNLCVLPECRHKKVGEALFLHAIVTAADRDCRMMKIGIVEENKKLRAWYEKLGAVHTGTKKFDFFPFTCGYMEKKIMVLPEKIRSLIAEETYKIDDIGMSGSSILLYESMVLKVQESGEEAENEYRMMQYLQGRLPVPMIYACERVEDKSYLLMRKCAGEMACSQEYMQNPSLLCKLLADGLKRLWSIDISDCPSDQSLSHKLARAEYNILNGLVDLDNVQPDTFGENGFRDPAELLQWLWENKPEEELVLSHGDYCLPNLFGDKGEVSGYIDLGRAGVADKWCDIAICYRSLCHNFSGKYAHNEEEYPDLDGMLLFRELGIEPDWEKIRYYILLDELF